MYHFDKEAKTVSKVDDVLPYFPGGTLPDLSNTSIWVADECTALRVDDVIYTKD